MTQKEIISWLLVGDVSVQYQVYRDLLGKERPGLRNKIASEGWGAVLLSCKQANGHWGRGFYQPKWTSTHYTLLDLKNLGISPRNDSINATLQMVFEQEKGTDGGINPSPSLNTSDVCINGMVLNYASYFKVNEALLKTVVDFLLSQAMPDGGFNCQSNRKGAIHSSLHSTLSVLEGILEYKQNGYTYRLKELESVQDSAQEFILIHRLFRSHRTGDIINDGFLKFHYPPRWHYDILKAMDYFQFAKVKYDLRMEEAIEMILSKRTAEGQWKLAANYPGLTHLSMERPGAPSRWNTLRALRVLKHFNPGEYQ